MVKFLSYLKSQREDMLNFLEEVVNKNTSSYDKKALDDFILFLDSRFKRIGCSTGIIRQQERGNLLRVSFGEGGSKLLLLCHIDTVWPSEEVTKRRFQIKDDRAYGPGVLDMKAGLVSAFYSIQTLQKLAIEPQCKIVILFNSDEEIGSPVSRSIIEQEAKTSRAVFILEPSSGAVKTSRKGVGRFKLKIKGKSAHAGANPEAGISALEELSYQILRLHRMTDLENGVTINVGVASGGTRSNVIAEKASAEIDLRIMNNSQANKFKRKILNLHPKLETELEVMGRIVRPPMQRTETTLSLFKIAKQIALKQGFELQEEGCGGASDGNFTAALGIPTLDGLGAVGFGGHSLDEHIMITSSIERNAFLIELITNM